MTKLIKVPIYNFELYISVSDNLRDAIRGLPKKCGKDNDDGDETCKGVTFANYPYYGIGYAALCIDRGIVAHEVGHAARAMMYDIGFDIDGGNDEPLAYLEDWLTLKVYAFLEDCLRKT